MFTKEDKDPAHYIDCRDALQATPPTTKILLNIDKTINGYTLFVVRGLSTFLPPPFFLMSPKKMCILRQNCLAQLLFRDRLVCSTTKLFGAIIIPRPSCVETLLFRKRPNLNNGQN